MPGSARIRPSTTRRKRGRTEIKRSTRSTRRARKTAKASFAGINATATTATSKTFHGSPVAPGGSDDPSYLSTIAWYGDGSGAGKPKVVGLKAPNGLGLHDISGNVWEWTNDWFGEYPSDPQVDPVGPPKAWGRVFRSGCWHLGAWLSRVSVRFEDEPEGLRVSDTGMRVAIDP